MVVDHGLPLGSPNSRHDSRRPSGRGYDSWASTGMCSTFPRVPLTPHAPRERPIAGGFDSLAATDTG